MVSEDTELHTGIRMHNVHFAEFPVQVACGTDCALPRDSEIKPLSAVQSYVCTHLQTCTEKPVGSSPSFNAPSGPETGACLSALRYASKAHAGEDGSVSAEAVSAARSSPTETTKQITSITFASRKRSPPPLPASPVPSAGLTEAIPRDLLRLGAESIDGEQLGPGRQLPEALNPSVSARSSDTCLRENVELSLGGDGQLVSLTFTGDRSPERQRAALEENSQARRIEEKLQFVTENREEATAASRVFTGLRGNDRPFGGGRNEDVDPGGKDWPLSINLPQQMTENDYLQNGFSDSFGSFVPDSNRWGEAATSNGALLPSSSLDRVSIVMPVSPSSPARKALSGVHITLSPKRLDFPSSAAKETEVRQSGVPQPVTSSGSRVSLDTTSKLKPPELHPQIQDSAYFPRPVLSPGPSFSCPYSSEVADAALHQSQELVENRLSRSFPDQERPGVLGSGGENRERNLKITVSSQTEKLSSDAITQITTESPEKTTYSAEIFVSADDGESSAVRLSRWKSREVPRAAPPALDQASALGRQTSESSSLPAWCSG